MIVDFLCELTKIDLSITALLLKDLFQSLKNEIENNESFSFENLSKIEKRILELGKKLLKMEHESD